MSSEKNKIKYIELTATHFLHELRNVVSDFGAMLILIGAVLIYPIVYSIAYYNETLTEIPFGVVDQDHSELSRKYIRMLDATQELKVSESCNDIGEAEKLLLENKISGAVFIPKGFQRDILSGKQTNISLYADASYFLKYRNEFLSVSTVNAYFGAGVSVVKYLYEGKSFAEAKAAIEPVSAQVHVLYNPSTGYGSFIMPSIILIIIQQTLLIGIGLMGGSFSESKTSPFMLPPEKRHHEVLPLLLGKTGVYLLVSAINICFAVFMVHHWFNYPDKSNFLQIIMLLFPYLLSTIFLGIGVSTIFKHRESAIVFMVFLSPVALFVSGLSWPASAIPELINTAAKILPSTTAVPAYLRLRMMGVDITEVKNELIFLYVQALVYFLLLLGYFISRIKIKKAKVTAHPEKKKPNS
ncbi:MAG: ABC transporter permease [Bacteroidia bacterium]|nr:ABC transporter permease [Bacteroidia bacterium]